MVEWIAIRFEEGTYLLEVKDLHDFERNEVPHNVSVSRPPDGAQIEPGIGTTSLNGIEGRVGQLR